MASIKRIGKDNLGIPVWEVVYRLSNGKQVRKRLHMPTRAEVERQVLLDCGRSGAAIRWTEGAAIYLEAKRLENRSPVAMGHVERAVNMFVELMGDMAIEDTGPEVMKDFMSKVVVHPVKNRLSGKVYRLSGPKVANHHRKELLTVARYLLRHTNKVSSIPFANVPAFSVKKERRTPIPADRVNDYLDALSPPVRRPVEMVLYYGLRSSAVCNLEPSACDGRILRAVDKGDVVRDIPVDPFLRSILDAAAEHRATFPNAPARLFINPWGRAWERTSLLRAAQKEWKAAGLEKKKIHEVRHTLGTLAGKEFTAGMVQAAMGHRSRKSAEVYFHPDEEMAAEVREKIITKLSQNRLKPVVSDDIPLPLVYNKTGAYECPCCHSKLLISKEKGRKSS